MNSQNCAGYFLNEILQPPTLDEFESVFGSVFPMSYEVQGQLEIRGGFSIRIMNSSWRDLANTNVFHKGEQLYLQVSASPGPGQQLYVQSCHASSSPDPADKPEVALIINNGCVASKESLVKFVYRRSDIVNLVLHASSLKSKKVYLHCSLSLSDLGLTSNTKFCNYNKLKSSWVDLGGRTSVCKCCGRSCRSLSERGDLPVFLELTAVVSTGPLIIDNQQTEPQATQLALSDSTTKSSPTVKNFSDKKSIMAGASFSKSSTENVGNGSPWPVLPSFGRGVMVISQGLGGASSVWLPELLDLQLNPVIDFGVGYTEYPAVVDLTFQSDDPFRRSKPEEWHKAKEQPVDGQHWEFAVDEGNAYVKAVDSHDRAEDRFGKQDLADVSHLNKIEREPVVTEEKDQLEQPQLKPSQSLSIDQMPTNKVIEGTENGRTEDEGEMVFRQAEMVFKGAKGTKSSEPLLLSKLSLKAAADGSSSLNYEEQKRPGMSKKNTNAHQLKMDVEKSQKDEKMDEKACKIKDLVSSLLDGLRGLWTM
ncbi:uncharacterized protein LOC127662333 [Xyrauchen texanus]|uniref:uncharacterized protein LOC127662333 n=1 Tax=Xyrauchen texanus TaxID=154827 RepID=UPI0022420635|nr:uncharacterized protein LOC127662333 [Xyrauchen texanus]